MVLVIDAKGRVMRNWTVQEGGSWKLMKLKVDEYPCVFLSFHLHPKSTKEETHWTFPDGREYGCTPTVPKHDERRPVLEAGLSRITRKGPNGVAIFSVEYWYLEVLTSNLFLTFGCSHISTSTENAGMYLSVTDRKCKRAPAPCQPALRTESAACVRQAKHNRWDWRMDTCQ